MSPHRLAALASPGDFPRRDTMGLMLRKLVVALAATAAVVVSGNAGATSMSAPAAIRTAADSLNMTENVQFFWSGHDYCWYDDGWNGPGWYWCDMYLQSGIGWGGGYGWHHWRGDTPIRITRAVAAVMSAERSLVAVRAVKRSLVAVMALKRSLAAVRAVERLLVAVAAARAAAAAAAAVAAARAAKKSDAL